MKTVLAICVCLVIGCGEQRDRGERTQPEPVGGVDVPEEAKEFEKTKALAEKGDAKAQYNLGLMYFNGRGGKQDFKEAVKWHQKAADQGHAMAQYNLGNMYYNGWGVKQDFKEAVKWYQKVADQGDADAQYNLGVMYERGEGVEQDNVTAYAWYNIAVANGNGLFGKEHKDIITKEMTAEQIAEVEALTKEMTAKNPKLIQE